MFIVGSLVNVDQWRPKSLQMTGMPKSTSSSSLLEMRSCFSVIGAHAALSLQLAFCKK